MSVLEKEPNIIVVHEDVPWLEPDTTTSLTTRHLVRVTPITATRTTTSDLL